MPRLQAVPAVLALFAATLLAVLPTLAGESGAPVLEARVLLLDGLPEPEVRVELQVRNVGAGTLRACIGRRWGWSFPSSHDLGTRVMGPPRAQRFELLPGKVFRWTEKLTYAGPKAWIEAVAFEVELLGGNCKEKSAAWIVADPVMLTERAAPPQR